jgi:predicted nicotinamide N-methyase
MAINLPSPVLQSIKLCDGKYVNIHDQVFFQTGDDGVHQWESGIVLARWCIGNEDRIRNARVLELGSGTGLAGICCEKYCRASSVTLTDYNAKVLENIERNKELNLSQVRVVRLDWTQPSSYIDDKFDIIIGSDLVYIGAPISQLADTIQHHLAPNGELTIIMPNKRRATPEFIEAMTQRGFMHAASELDDPFLYSSPNDDEVRGFKDFPELKLHRFLVHSFRMPSYINIEI